jgi:hypothetical protein
MKNALKNNNSKFILIGKINGLSQQAKRARVCLRSKCKQPWIFAIRQNVIGSDVRHHLLAYAFLRGVPYHSIEATTREDNKPQSEKIYKIIEQHAPNYIPYNHYDKSGGGSYSVKVEDVAAWLNGDE